MVFAERSAGRAAAAPDPVSAAESGAGVATESGAGVATGAGAPAVSRSRIGVDGGAGGRSPALWCAGIRKRYGRRRLALDGVRFEVARGEILGLLGPNGAGKTSLIKILLGLVHADAGEVMLLGRPADAGRGRARSRTGVGYLPELFRFQPWLTADEVLALHAKLAKVTWPAQRRQESLAEVGLAERGGDRVGGFSKGMQQRLGLAVALIGDPELVILDEPTSALDPLGRADVRDLVLRLRERGTTVVLNSHLIGEVERVCDRVVILDRGRVVSSGTLAELLGRRQVRLLLDGAGSAAMARLERTGPVTRSGDHFVVDLGLDDVVDLGVDDVAGSGVDGSAPASGAGVGSASHPDVVPELVKDLVALGARVHAVEPIRISLEDRLLELLRREDMPS